VKRNLRGTLRLAVGLAAALASGTALAQQNLLAGKRPIRERGVRHSEVLTDGRAPRDGDPWRSAATATFDSADAFVVYDLGAGTALAAGWLQGDNNDVYLVEASPDGSTWQVAWQAGPEPEAGLRVRQSNQLSASGRYLRVRAREGDGAYSLSELQLFSAVPPVFPPAVDRIKTASADRRARDSMLTFGLALGLLVLLSRRGAPLWWTGLLVLLAAATGLLCLLTVRDALPIDARTVGLARAVIALVAAAAVLRECFPPARFPAHRGVILGTLGLTGVLGLLAFYNLGQPQFWDARRGQDTFVHYLDLRQYYPTAKYFPQLGYTDIYLADMAAFREEADANLDSINQLPMRDLSTLHMGTVGEKEEQVAAVRARFSPERWQAYKRDATYFREVMGTPLYLAGMHDMGGNATPVWMSIAYLLFNNLDPGEGAFAVTGLIDLVLLLITFALIGRCFGLRTMLVAAVIFGANDFIMYGTNWAGATLRHDWLACLGLAACALKRDHLLLGGALLGYATMIRAFPGLTFVAVGLPALWRIVEQWRAAGAFPGWRRLYEQNRSTVRILLGGAATMALLFAFSAAILPLRAWGDWLHKVGLLSSEPHHSSFGLRSLIAGWQADQHAVLRARLPLFIAALVFYLGMTVVAARGRRPEQAMLLGLPLVPVLLNPGNYYIHIVFLLPLLVEERPSGAPLPPAGAGIWATLLAMCAVQYGTVLVPDQALHFYLANAVLFAVLATLLFFLVRERALAAGWYSPAA
jgi:hypothetical protein